MIIASYLLGIGACAGALGLIAAYDLDLDGQRWIDRFLGRRPLTRAEALSGPPRHARRARQWGVQPRRVRDWAADPDLRDEVA